jgi:hypothetical protein
MGFRFQKRIRIFKALTLNISKTGTSWTLGHPGASINIRGKKVTGSVGIPGSGLSYRETLSDGEPSEQPRRSGGLGRLLFWIVVLLLAGYLIGR